MWLSRDKDAAGRYNIHGKKPSKRDVYEGVTGSFWWKNFIKSFCPHKFERTTGIKLDPGQFREVELKPVGDVWELQE